MSDIVFVLGAGASRRAGAPLMNDFIDTAESMLRADKCGDGKASFELVFKAIAALQPVYAKAVIDTNNLEAVFAAFEMAKLFGQLGTLSAPELEALPGAIRSVIVRTLEHTIDFPVDADRILAPPPYDQFCQLLDSVQRTTASILTFNYDLAIDYGLFRQGIVFDYGLDPTKVVGRLDVLKLHGSLNWMKCYHCGVIAPWTLSEFFNKYSYSYHLHSGSRAVSLDVGQKLPNFAHCADAPPSQTAEPFLVPPTWSKTGHYEALGPVWQRAAAHLAQARDIVVIGYSLPETDEFFRYLYALGTVSSQRLRRFWVIDPDPSGKVRQRFEALLGPLAFNRFLYSAQKFEEAIGSIVVTYTKEMPGR
jgi:hypothetical protein